MNKETVTSHQEKKEKLTTSLDNKIRFVKSIHEFVLRLDNEENNISSRDLEMDLWDMLETHIGEDEGLEEGFDKVKRERGLRIEKNTEEMSFKLAYPKEKIERSAEHRKLLEDIENEINEIEEDQQVFYIKQLIRYVAYLKHLKKDRDEFKEVYDNEGGVFKKDGLLANKINNFLLAKYKDKPKGYKQGNLGNANYINYIKNVRFKGLGTVIVFKSSARVRLRDFNYLGGKSYGGSSVYFCFDDDRNDSVDQHEYNHTLFGAHVNHEVVYHQRFIGDIHNILNTNNFDNLPIEAFEDLIKNGHSSRADRLDKYISTYHKKLMGEIFADLNNIFDNQIADGFYGHFDQSVDELKLYFKAHIKDENTKKMVKEAYEKLSDNLKRYMGELAKIVYCSNVLDVKEDMISSFLVLGGDVRKISRYLMEKFGDSKIDEVLKGFNPERDKIYKSEVEKIVFGKIHDISKGGSV